MPGVNVQPASTSGFGSFNASTQNGTARLHDGMTIAEIKDKAKDNVQKEARGASAMTLIKTARNQSLRAKNLEDTGDLKSALDAVTKAASLTALFMDSPELAAEKQPGKHGVLHREFKDFMTHDGGTLVQRSDALETKLAEMEKMSPIADGVKTDNASVIKLGGSIADRMRLLKDAGLSVGTPKRLSNPNLSNPPLSLDLLRPDGYPVVAFSSPKNHLLNVVPSTPISSAPSPHALVSPSTLGPPSPTSSPSSSPRLSHLNLSEFSQTFPSIDELDELDILEVHSKDISTSQSPRNRSFPVLPVDPGPRPSSTPVTPTVNSFMSRPGSPTMTPTVSKPSNFGPSGIPVTHSTPMADKPELPVTNLVSPKTLHEYSSRGLKVLMLDVRYRAEFEKEHIKAEAVVCLEPSVLLRENVNGEMLEDSLTVGPLNEWTLFCNRDKFDLVALYDSSSRSFGPSNTPLSALFRAIYETAFRKVLKKMPMLIVGGLDLWRKELGEGEVVHGRVSSPGSDSQKVTAVQGSSTSAGPFNDTLTSPFPEPHKVWTPHSKGDASRAPSEKEPPLQNELYSIDRISGPLRTSPDKTYLNGNQAPESTKPFTPRKPPVRPPSIPISPSNARNLSDNIHDVNISQSMVNGVSPISYPQFPRQYQSVSASASSFTSSSGLVSPPPQASINPTLSRRRSDYVDQSQEALSGLHSASRTTIDYPDLLRRPPVAASSALERQDNRPRLVQHSHSYSSAISSSEPKPPRIQSDYPVTYWSDIQIGTSGLKNLGNTCYMNATIQCLSATVPFARFFTDGRWKHAVNYMNPLGSKGNLARSFARLLHEMWHGELPHITPMEFRSTICAHADRFRGSDQHDSQEFLSFLLDGIHEDLNRILNKPPWVPTPEHEAELERLPQQIASEQEWRIWKMRNDSLIVDFFQGQFRNRLECMTCHHTSTTYDPFTSLPLPVPARTSKVSLRQCLDAFVKTEVMEKNDAWRCPHCKELRKTTKQLSLSRLPPILIVHLKRFSFEGRWTDKIDTFIDFPMKALDLTNYIPPPLPPGVDKGPLNGPPLISPEDPRSQLPPYRYDLYAVTNHFGSLSSGHYTAFVSSRGGWLYCDDSSVKTADAREVVNRQAYILFYKRTRV